MAEYELPPLRIKIIGDGKSFKKALDTAVKDASTAVDQINKLHQAQKKQMADAMAAARKKEEYERRLEKYLSDGRQKRKAVENAIHMEAFRANRQVEASQRRQLANAQKIAAETARARKQFAESVLRARPQRSVSARPSRTSRVTGGSRDGGMGFLGDRADIYMHIIAVKNLASAWSAPLNKLAEYQTKIAALAPLLGGKDKAEKFVQGVRTSTIGQVYGSEIPTAAARFMGAGMDMAETQSMLEAVGEIAAGDTAKFQGLARAFSQVAAQGNLQGDELEQLAENDFPLLLLMQQRTGLSLDVLRDKMAKREITSKAVIALLKAETSQGGRYAGTLKGMSATLGVAVNRVKSFYDALSIEALKTVSDELVKYVNKLASGLSHALQWVKANQETVKGYVQLALKASAAVLAFHALGFAVAMVHWQLHAVRRIMAALSVVTGLYTGALRLMSVTVVGARIAMSMLWASMLATRTATAGLVATTAAWFAAAKAATIATWTYGMSIAVVRSTVEIFNLAFWSMNQLLMKNAVYQRIAAAAVTMYNGVLRGLNVTFKVLRIGALLAWASMALPVVAVIAGVLAVAGAIGVVLASIKGEGGLMGAVSRLWGHLKNFAINTVGFFMNIGHNSKVVGKYIYDNFWTMVQDVGTILLRFAENYISDMVLTFGTVSKLFSAFMGWVITNAPSWGYSIVDGLWTGFTWLFNKIKEGFRMAWEYATTGKLSADFDAHMTGIGEAFTKGANDGFLATAGTIIQEHQNKSALLNNWDNMNLKSPAIEGLKFDWKSADAFNLGTGIPDVDFSGPEIPGAPGGDIAGMIGGAPGEKDKGAKKQFSVPNAIRLDSKEYQDAWDSITMSAVKTATPDEKVAKNTAKTNDILTKIHATLQQGPMMEPALQ